MQAIAGEPAAENIGQAFNANRRLRELVERCVHGPLTLYRRKNEQRIHSFGPNRA
jgi:hypothetical protein